MQMYILDFGVVVVDDYEGTVNYFTLPDAISVERRINSGLKAGRFFDSVEVISDEFVDKFVRNRKTKAYIDEYKSKYATKAKSFSSFDDTGKILDLLEVIPKNQTKNFMYSEHQFLECRQA